MKHTKMHNTKLTDDAVDFLCADPAGSGGDGTEVEVLAELAGVASGTIALEPGPRHRLAHPSVHARRRVAGVYRLVAVQTCVGGGESQSKVMTSHLVQELTLLVKTESQELKSN